MCQTLENVFQETRVTPGLGKVHTGVLLDGTPVCKSVISCGRVAPQSLAQVEQVPDL